MYDYVNYNKDKVYITYIIYNIYYNYKSTLYCKYIT